MRTAAQATEGAPTDPARRALLERGSISTGNHWSETWRNALRSEGRPAVGGWPGTMNEARSRVTAFFAALLARSDEAALSLAEREWAARTAYAAARRDWLRHGDGREIEP